MDETKVQSALLGWIITLAITVSIALRRDKDTRQKLFVGLCATIALYYFSSFLFNLTGTPIIERISLCVALSIPIMGLYFFRSFSNFQRPPARINRLAWFLAFVLMTGVVYPRGLRPAIGPAILAYVIGFMLVAVFDLHVQARTAASRVDVTRIRYLVGGGFIVLTLQITDRLGDIFNIYIPPVGVAMTLLYLYIISQSIVRYRILDLYEMLGRLMVLTMMGGFLALLFFGLVKFGGTGEGFHLNVFVTSLVILLLFDPLRDLVEQKISDVFFSERLFLEQRVSDIRFKLAHVFNVETMVEILLSGLESSRRITHASLFLLDARGWGFEMVGAVGPKPESHRIEAAVARRYFRAMAKGGALVASALLARRERSLQAGKGETTEDLSESLRLMEQLKSDVILFLDGDQDLLGFLSVKEERIRDGFTQEEIKTLVGLANQAAITVENSQQYQKMKERDRLAALGEMSAGLAHEIRNPLGAIKAAAQFIEEEMQERDNNEDAEYLGIIVEEVGRLNRVVNDFLSYARPTGGSPGLLDPNDILQRTIQVYKTGHRGQMDISLEMDRQLPAVHIDGERLHQVFLNLILNAEQAMSQTAHPSLEITTKIRKVRKIGRGLEETTYANFVEIRFSDSGPGIEPAILQKIFIPFYTTKSSGSGLGLAVCQRLVRDAGGEIEVRSQVGHGTIFSVVLPATSPPENDNIASR